MIIFSGPVLCVRAIEYSIQGAHEQGTDVSHDCRIGSDHIRRSRRGNGQRVGRVGANHKSRIRTPVTRRRISGIRPTRIPRRSESICRTCSTSRARPTTLDFANYNGSAPLTGLGNPNPVPGNALYLAFHFGNGNDYWPPTGEFDVFFCCTSGCDTFTLPSTQGVSNYRLYAGSGGRATTPAVPEPLTVSLVGIGLGGLWVSRRRRCTIS
jgi:hypothetical protein